MNSFIEKNKRLLKIYYIAALIMGWTLIILSGVKTALLVFNVFRIGDSRMVMMGTFLEMVFSQIILGTFLLAVAQYIRFLTSGSNKAGGLTRHIDKIIYLYTIAKVAQMRVVYISLTAQAKDAGPYFSAWRSFALYATPTIAYILVLVGLGLILKRSIPIIKESKTLI
jgi:hypothetical protein